MDLLSLGIVGAIASLIVQLVKTKIGEGLPRAIVAVVIALILGAIAYVLEFLPSLKEALVGVVVLSNIAYGVVVRHILPKE